MTTAHREVERKFRVPTGWQVPPLVGIDGVAAVETHPSFSMANDYYDTADLRLFRWGITLRRRAGGPDAGWHLKLPVAGKQEGVRDEIRAPLSDEVPAQLTRLVTPFARGEALEYVAGIRTLRAPAVLLDDAGVARVEIVDDHVDIVGGASFREIEAEAIPGPDGSLDEGLLERVSDALLASGAVPGSMGKAGAALGPRAAVPPDIEVVPWPTADAPAGDAVHAYLAHHARRLLLADLLLRRDLPDAVHQMRVSARRLRSGLKTFAPLLEADWADRLRGELGWMASGLGEARDAEVLQERLDAHAVLLGEDGEDLARAVIDAALQARIESGEEAARAIVDSSRYVSLLDALVEGVRRPPLTAKAANPGIEVLPRLVSKAFRRLDRRVSALEMDAPSAQWHEARIAAKRARYAADAVAPVIGDRMSQLAERLADVTEVLGSHQDAHVAQAALRAMIGAPDGVDVPAAFALGRLLAVEQAAEIADREAFLRLWPSVRKTAHHAGVC